MLLLLLLLPSPRLLLLLLISPLFVEQPHNVQGDGVGVQRDGVLALRGLVARLWVLREMILLLLGKMMQLHLLSPLLVVVVVCHHLKTEQLSLT